MLSRSKCGQFQEWVRQWGHAETIRLAMKVTHPQKLGALPDTDRHCSHLWQLDPAVWTRYHRAVFFWQMLSNAGRLGIFCPAYTKPTERIGVKGFFYTSNFYFYCCLLIISIFGCRTLWHWCPYLFMKSFRIYQNNNLCSGYIKYLHNFFNHLLHVQLSLFQPCFFSSPAIGLSLNYRVGWKIASYRITHEERPLVYRLQTRGGRRIWFNGRLSYQAVEEKRSICLSVSLPGSFNIRSLAVSLGSKHIDLNLYQKRIKSSWEITFSLLKGWRSVIPDILLANKYINCRLRGI